MARSSEGRGLGKRTGAAAKQQQHHVAAVKEEGSSPFKRTLAPSSTTKQSQLTVSKSETRCEPFLWCIRKAFENRKDLLEIESPFIGRKSDIKKNVNRRTRSNDR